MKRSLIERWIVPGCLTAATFGLYLLTLSHVHTYDALTYINDVDRRTGMFFHPHHLLYSPTGWLFWQLWRIAGYRGNSEVALQILNAAAGAACGFGLYRVTLHLTQQVTTATVAACFLWFNYATWYFSVDVEVYLLALLWLLLTLPLLIELVTAPRPRTAPLLGFALGGAALYHQINVLLTVVVLVAAALAPLPWRGKLASIVRCGVVAGSCVGLGYGIVGFAINGYRSPAQFRDWIFLFAKTGWWGHATRDRWTDLGAGLGNTLSPEGAWPYWVGIVGLLLVGGLALRRWPRVVLICGTWIAVYGTFFAWWEADNVEFWIATLLPLWLLVGLSLAAISNRAVAALALVGCGLLAWHNYPLVERHGNPAFDLHRHYSTRARELTKPNDLIVEPGGVLEQYLPYYEQRSNIRTINGALFETNGDIERALAQLQSYLWTNLHAGQAVLVGRNALQLPPDRRERHDVPQPRLDAFWVPYRSALEVALVDQGDTIFWRIPSARELAGGQGWHWTSFDWGWKATNVSDERFDDAWCFNPGSDPMLTSPVLGIDAASFAAVEITLSTVAQGQSAQLFFGGPDGVLSEVNGPRFLGSYDQPDG